MSFDYAGLSTTANNIIAEFGGTVTVTSKGTQTYDIDTGAVVSSDTVETTKGVITNYDKKDIDGTMILQGDKLLLLSAIGITTVKPNAKVTIGTVDYNVIAVNETNPAGIPLLYELQIRGV